MQILLTNDDGYRAPGLAALIEIMKPYGQVTVVAPEDMQSGMSSALTTKIPVRLRKITSGKGLEIYACSGTPVDCVKLAMSCILPEKPDLLVSGINHGINASSAVIYSGTLGAAMEGTLYGVPSIGFSLADDAQDADFNSCKIYGTKIIDRTLQHPFAPHVFLNVNFPALPAEKIKGVRLARQHKGSWIKEFEKRTDPHGFDYYWLTGQFVNHEPGALDADENLCRNGYISIVPHQLDMTEYSELQRLQKEWQF
ncbi:MAG: 5'/3'-nucleotidase SurE [Prevotellaceae bacterium]|jgi:5'-nucleotidase|nr:5'/3'-nucleotidase SurE [Prevotellaceae bacterium]